MSSNGNIKGVDDAYYFSIDIHEDGIKKIHQIKETNKFAKVSKIWHGKNMFLWMINDYEDDELYEKITNDKLKEFPKIVRDIINDPQRFEEKVKKDDENDFEDIEN